MQHNPRLRVAKTQVAISTQAVKQGASDLLPSVGIAASYRRQSKVPELTFPKLNLPPGFPPVSLFPDQRLSLGVLDNYDLRLTITQPIFTGLRLLNRYRASQEQWRAHTFEEKRILSELIFRVERDYAQVLRSQRLLVIAETALQQMVAHQTDVAHFVNQGLAREDELLKMKVKVAEAELGLVQARNALKLAQTTLVSTMGTPLVPGTRFIEVPQQERIAVEASHSVELALKNRVELQSLAANHEIAQAMVKVTQGKQFPNVAGFASFGYGRPGMDFIKDEWMDYWLVGISAEWTLWNWGKTNSEIQQARLVLDQTNDTKSELELMIRTDATVAALQLNEALEKITVSEKLEQAALQSYAVCENNYRQGLVTNTEYLDSQSELMRAQLAKAQAEADNFVARSNWRRAIGDNLATITNR